MFINYNASFSLTLLMFGVLVGRGRVEIPSKSFKKDSTGFRTNLVRKSLNYKSNARIAHHKTRLGIIFGQSCRNYTPKPVSAICLALNVRILGGKQRTNWHISFNQMPSLLISLRPWTQLLCSLVFQMPLIHNQPFLLFHLLDQNYG